MGNSIDIDPLATLFKLTHGRNDTPFEAQFSGFFQAKAGMATGAYKGSVVFSGSNFPADNQTIAVKTFGRGGKKNEGRIVEPRWDFHQYG